MNANELADWIEDDSVVDIMLTSQEHYRGLVATMLRQQQAEIEALKNKIKSYENLGNMMLDELLEKAQEK